MTIVAVYAKSGVKIPSNRLVRFTGNYTAPCGWEVDLPAKGQRAHAVSRAGPANEITDAVWGQAETFGPVAYVEVSAATAVDDELEAQADGRLAKAALGSKNRSALAVAPAAAGAKCRVLLAWSQLP